ncbi:MAG: transporter substrate-binding domain-containing protein [Pseudomonadota bacterium]
MKTFLTAGLVLAVSTALTTGLSTGARAETLQLGNEPWPPFVLAGDARGTAEAIVCEALERADYTCTMNHDGWEATLAAARTGELDGIAAAWYTVDRGRDLKFSTAYLTNRLVPVTLKDGPSIQEIGDLHDQRVALEVDVAYGEALLAARSAFDVVDVRGADAALEALRQGEADVAVVDELFVRDALGDDAEASGLSIGEVALAYRELHFAVSRSHPQAGQILADFNLSYREMVRDGTVNRILDMEWLATDLGSDGVMDFIHRGGGLNAAVADVASRESVYALGQDEYEAIRDPGFQGSNANFLSDDKAYETPEAAMQALDSGRRCSYDSLTARIVCN